MLKFIFSQKTTINLVPVAISRIAVGIFFLITGLNKLFNPVFQKSMLKTITGIGFPYPQFTANFTAIGEAVFGLSLAIGWFTRFSSAGLMVILMVALFTFDIPNHIPQGLDPFTWYSYFLYLPQVLYLLILLGTLVMGGGPFSVDQSMKKLTNK